jgi:hypothetical protein
VLSSILLIDFEEEAKTSLARKNAQPDLLVIAQSY